MARAFRLKVSNILVTLCVVAMVTLICAVSDEARRVYIVYMGKLDETEHSLPSHHINLLQEVVDTRFVKQSLVRSYTKSFNGFAANLTAEEHKKIANYQGVLSTFPSQIFQLQTTRSWDFMGLSENVRRNPTTESDIIIGVIDSGIWPESQSFNGEGFGPPPKKWKGVCKGGTNFTCNNKLIGARYYDSLSPAGGASARDTVGHGSHTASIAAGNFVKDVSFYGIAKGAARGGVPSARIAAYKVCPANGCTTEDILAGFDDAIADGVDIITVSIGGMVTNDITFDPIAIGSLHASLKGILTVQSAGNVGSLGSVNSVAPWIFTVAASNTDRSIVSRVALGNGMTLVGKAVNSFQLKGTTFPVEYGKNISSTCDEIDARNCAGGCLQKDLVKGKVVLCEAFEGVQEAFGAGAIGSIAQSNSPTTDVSSVVPLPASGLNHDQFAMVQNYINSAKVPTADILVSESIRNPDAPVVARFSSKGPNIIIPDILKPDVTAPGVEILAAYSPVASPSSESADKRSVNYSILSGTSMSCPHVAGAAAYVKSLHPDWSPSAIKSALMTTTWRMNATKDPDAEFSYGSGHIDPVRAADPGLVYETLPEDYVKMLCGMGYNTSTTKKILGIDCPEGVKPQPKDVNYPSMSCRIKASEMDGNTNFSVNFTRMVTNVGFANSTYKATTSKSSEYDISVNPSILTFQALNEKKSFEVIISGRIGRIDNYETIFASLEWSDGVHNVRSPVVVYQDRI